MTFDQIRSEVLERMSLSSSDASTRVGAAINRHYKRITSLLGMETTRYVSKDVLMTVGVRTVTVPGVEKVDRVADISGQPRPLSEVSLHQMRSLEPTAVEPQVWALSNTQAQSVVLMFDTFPTFAWTLRIDGWTTLTDLTGSGEPAFPASFHDILTWFVLAEELLRKEKSQLAAAYEQKAAGLLEDLRFHLADTHTRTLVQNSHPGGATGGSGQGGGGGAPGGAQYLTNIPPGTVVGRASDQGTGNSQPITTGPHLLMTGSVLDAVGYVDTAGTPGAGAVAEFADANTIRAVTRTLVDKTGTPAATQVAVFDDADTVAGTPNLTYASGLLTITAGGARIDLTCTPAAANNRTWALSNFGDPATLKLYALDDLGNVQAQPLEFHRTGVIALPQGRLQFPATQIPSADPYTLDDYREGYWTPVLGGLSGNSGQVYGIQDGFYIKKGRDVTISGRIDLTTVGTFSGALLLGGLPFPMMSHYNPGSVHATHWGATSTRVLGISGFGQSNANYFRLVIAIANSTGTVDMLPSDITNGLLLLFGGHYFAAN